MEFFTSLHFPPRRTNAKAPPRTLRKSKPESSTRLKTSPKLQCPVQDFRIKDHPCGQLHCRHRGWHSTLLRRARPTACLLPPPQDLGAATPSNPQQTPLHTGCRPTQSGKARGPLRPISGPRRCYPRCHREYARLRDLPRCGDPSLAISTRCGDPPIVKPICWDNPPIVKTKISASLQLFCDYELFPVPAKRNRGLYTANYLRFCAAIRDWGARSNCQSQKSCNSDRFFVSGLLGGPPRQCWDIVGPMRNGGGSGVGRG